MEQSKSKSFPLVSVITVVYNSIGLIEQTIKSVLEQNYPNLEYIIIDGGSTDGTIEVINKYQDKISIVLSEPDRGIYDAMNKGIAHSNGEWINFMNSGDCFYSKNVLIEIFSDHINDPIQFIYSDYYIKQGNRSKKYTASLEMGRILHQSCIYKKSIHADFGKYYVSKPIIVSDYLFFNLLPKNYYFKTDTIISINDGDGISSGKWIIPQRYCVDFLFGRISLFRMFFQIFLGNIKYGILTLISKFKF